MKMLAAFVNKCTNYVYFKCNFSDLICCTFCAFSRSEFAISGIRTIPSDPTKNMLTHADFGWLKNQKYKLNMLIFFKKTKVLSILLGIVHHTLPSVTPGRPCTEMRGQMLNLEDGQERVVLFWRHQNISVTSFRMHKCEGTGDVGRRWNGRRTSILHCWNQLLLKWTLLNIYLYTINVKIEPLPPSLCYYIGNYYLPHNATMPNLHG